MHHQASRNSAHSYRATLIPAGIELSEVEFQDAQGLLPTIRLRETSAERAMASAYRVSGRPVLHVERVDA